ncbi:hypothetical protein MKW92_039359 [Papaver armeniacum]|nr:hypothetical protein MKW92_039359 [Papaver armeniacum]
MVIVDDEGDELHAIIPKNLIWKFDKQIREGGLYTIEKLHLTTAKPKFKPANEYTSYRCCWLLKDHHQHTGASEGWWAIQPNARDKRLRMLVLVDVCSTFVKNYQGKLTLSSTNATKVYNNVDIPEIVEMRTRCPYARPPRHITVATRKGKSTINIFDPDNMKPYLSSSLPNGIHPARQLMSSCVLGDDDDLWCTKCEAKVDMPIARYMLRFEVEDLTGTTVFAALDSEVQKLVRHAASELIGTSEILHKAVDFQITLNSFQHETESAN